MVRQAERRRATTGAILTAARELFVDRGYAAVSIDEIAAAAGVAKGAVYHHFPSKAALLERVVDDVQGAIAEQLVAGTSPDARPTVDTIAGALTAYLRAATAPAVRRVLLVDGPAVLGWRRWREIDDAHFAGMTRRALAAVMPATTSATELDSATRLLLGAIMEAAMAAADDAGPAEDVVAVHGATLRHLLGGLAGPTRAGGSATR